MASCLVVHWEIHLDKNSEMVIFSLHNLVFVSDSRSRLGLFHRSRLGLFHRSRLNLFQGYNIVYNK
jgi:hypothetical protein